MILGTHNSLTAYPLKGWCKLLGWLAWTAKCQNLTIEQQYDLGVRYFNLQIGYLHNKWWGSHGLFWYDVDVEYILQLLNAKGDCHVQIYLDRHFLAADVSQYFKKCVREWKARYPHIIYEDIRIEKTWKLVSAGTTPANEKYWTIRSTEHEGCGYERLPYPLYWAKMDNARYRQQNTSEFLMLDFVDI